MNPLARISPVASLLALALVSIVPKLAAATESSPPISTTETTGTIPHRPSSDPHDPGEMGPPTNAAIVAAADAAVTAPMAPGPFQPTWESLQANYKTPSWFDDAKFGIFMHWGIYSVAAHHNEWYEKYMYANGADEVWHEQHFGPQEVAGYKNLIPLFTAKNWVPDAWALLFKKAGAKFVVPTAEHHDNFANWDSQVTPYNAKRMGPMRDLIGDLGAAVRKQGLKFGFSNHGIENFTFINPSPAIRARLQAAKADLFDPAWVDFYHVADRSDAAVVKFLTDWVNRNLELIDKYHPDILWFDNGVNGRNLDPLKLHVAAYYYNRAKEWGKEVSISTKNYAYAPTNDDTKQIGSIVDFEKVGTRSPAGIRPGSWMVDDPIGSPSWDYTEGMTIAGTPAILSKLIDTVSKGGVYLLNISPMADGTIPQNQQDTLLGIGQWLDVNGEAIYGTRPWTKFIEGNTGRGALNYHFTTKGDTLYAIASAWPGEQVTLASLAKDQVPATGKITVELLGHNSPLESTQDAEGLKVKLPQDAPAGPDYSFKITGFNLHAASVATTGTTTTQN